MFSNILAIDARLLTYLYLSFWFVEPLLKAGVHCVKSDYIWSFSGPYIPAFGLNTERYSECGKIQSRKTPNTDTFHAVVMLANLKENGTFEEKVILINGEQTFSAKNATHFFPILRSRTDLFVNKILFFLNTVLY